LLQIRQRVVEVTTARRCLCCRLPRLAEAAVSAEKAATPPSSLSRRPGRSRATQQPPSGAARTVVPSSMARPGMDATRRIRSPSNSPRRAVVRF
jgi:hypothetical protein